MKWTQSQPAQLPVSYQDAATHLRLVDDDDRQYVLDLIAAAVEYAETAMGCSLITRTITAIFNANEPLYLVRGPVQAVSSVQQTVNNTPITGTTPEGHGTADLLVIPSNAWQAPLTVAYTAGYGNNPTDVPADIRLAIRQHVATLYENRETVADKQWIPVPHTLADFYRLKAREVGIG